MTQIITARPRTRTTRSGIRANASSIQHRARGRVYGHDRPPVLTNRHENYRSRLSIRQRIIAEQSVINPLLSIVKYSDKPIQRCYKHSFKLAKNYLILFLTSCV